MHNPVLQQAGVRPVLTLALPILAEQLLSMMVGLTDTWVANHLPHNAAEATAAVGTIGYVLWFIGLMIGAVGTGATALIARATGARHRRLANSICGQVITLALVIGCVTGFLAVFFADDLARIARLHGLAHDYAAQYLRLVGISLPCSMVMMMGNASLRGAGDTVRPAMVMGGVNLLNVLLTIGLTFGAGPVPALGFKGIAIGTSIAYVVGALLVLTVLIRGKGGVRLHLHRLRPDWHNIKRLLRIGLPTGVEGMLAWGANFGVVMVINQIDPTYTMAAAHINTVRIESISFLPGFAFSIAAAALTGMALGARDPKRATVNVYTAYAIACSSMTFMGILFILFPRFIAGLISNTPEIADLTAQCIRVTGFIQFAFAANLVFGGALRGAGDTLVTMLLNLSSIIFLRLAGVLYVSLYLGKGLQAIWMVLAGELFVRGMLVFGRFASGRWKHVKV